MSKKETGKVLLYEGENGNVELRTDGEVQTIWATQAQIAELFGTTPQNITLHIQHVYEEGELTKEATCKNSLQVQNEKGRSVKRMVTTYDLDVIVAVGYRINSKKATKFRIWATGVLREYILEGYSLNDHKLRRDTDLLDDARDALDYIESDENPGKVKGRLVFSITKDFI